MPLLDPPVARTAAGRARRTTAPAWAVSRHEEEPEPHDARGEPYRPVPSRRRLGSLPTGPGIAWTAAAA